MPPAAVWLSFLVLFVEEGRSLTRTLWVETPKTFDTQRAQGRAVRVVSLNCAGGTKGVAAEVERFNPDVVLLQEIPKADEVQALALRLFGPSAGLHLKLDTAVLTRWPARPLEQDRISEKFAAGVVTTLPDGRELIAVSLHLIVPPLDFTPWSPATWRSYGDTRAVQRTQLGSILKMIGHAPPEALVIVGGDFNAPQGDGALQLLKPRLRDAFDLAGVGWGNTIINDLPLLRIDQVWASSQVRPVTVRAYKSANSDHRLVVAEFLLAKTRRTSVPSAP